MLVQTKEKFSLSASLTESIMPLRLLSNNQKLLRGVQGGGFLEKSLPGRRRQKKEITSWMDKH
jgi:hypothetical protein